MSIVLGDFQKEQNKLRRMIRSAPTAMALLDKNGNVSVRSHIWKQERKLNEAFRQCWAGIQQQLEANEIFTVILEVHHANSEPIHYKTVISKWTNESNQLNGYIVVSNPVSEFIEAQEKALRQAQLKSQFLANMSHEIRTPMNGVIGMLEMLKTTDLDLKQTEYIETISKSADALLVILNDILDFSKMEAGKLALSPSWCDMSKVIFTSFKTFQQSANMKNLNYNLKNNLPNNIELNLDSVRIQQMVTNLLSNAIKFTEAGSVTCEISLLGSPDYLQQLEIKVTDTGIGLTPDQVDRLFQVFSQADETTSKKFGGTGLGLAITKTLCDLMQGRIEASSQIMKGTTFTISLPTVSRFITPKSNHTPTDGLNSSSAKAYCTSDSLLKDLKILVAEDNLINQKVMAAMLASLKINFEIAADGDEAFEKFKVQKYDIILMDCQMPHKDGYQASLEIRTFEKNNNCPATPIIALTAHAFEAERQKCFSAGMDGFLTKPLTLEQLKSYLIKLLDFKQNAPEVLPKKSPAIAS